MIMLGSTLEENALGIISNIACLAERMLTDIY
jgi:hypothetical protein